MSKPWNVEEIDYLEEKWGSVSIPTISKNLNRSISGIKIKAYKLNFGRHIHSGEYITYNQLLEALGLYYSGSSERLIREGLLVRQKKSIKKSYKIVYIEDFWKWAEPNKMKIDFSKVEKNILGAEPWWVEEKRKADTMANRYKKTPWTKEEDSILISLLNAFRYSYREISIKLGRTEGALKRRMVDLNLRQRPLKAYNHNKWTPKEEEILVDLYYKGYTAEVMAEFIERSALSIKGKIERMIKDRDLLVERVNPKRPYIVEEQSGINYKEVLPKEKWPGIEHFLGTLSNIKKSKDQYMKENTKIDVGEFLKEYREMGGVYIAQ